MGSGRQKTGETKENQDGSKGLSKSEEAFAAASGLSIMVLEALKDAARFTPVPYLSEVSSLALLVVDAFQTCRSNKEGFKQLAADCCDLVFAIGTTCGGLMKDGKPLSAELEEHLKQLRQTLKTIIEFAGKQAKRNRIMRFLTNKSDFGKIQDYRERLRHSLALFGLQSDISIHETVKRIADSQMEQGQQAGGDDGASPRPIPGTTSGSLQVAFPGFTSSTFSGNIRFNNVVGDQNNTTRESNSTNTNSRNVYNTSYTSHR